MTMLTSDDSNLNRFARRDAGSRAQPNGHAPAPAPDDDDDDSERRRPRVGTPEPSRGVDGAEPRRRGKRSKPLENGHVSRKRNEASVPAVDDESGDDEDQGRRTVATASDKVHDASTEGGAAPPVPRKALGSRVAPAAVPSGPGRPRTSLKKVGVAILGPWLQRWLILFSPPDP
jgi:hypothetical protein